MRWVKMNRDLKEGDIIRAKLQPGHIYYMYDDSKKEEVTINKDGTKSYKIKVIPDAQYQPKKPTYVYAVADGGFGMNMNSLGNAIFVKHISDVLQETKEKKSKWSGRWEAYWGIEILEDN
jgi:hypothetical protein